MPNPPYIALATCAGLPEWEVDDQPLVDAAEAHGARCSRPVWDDPDLDWSAFDAVLIRTTWDYQEKLAAFLDWAQGTARVTRLFNPVSVIGWNTHKSYLRELGDRGARSLPTEWLDKGTRPDIAALIKARGWQRGFIKPLVGATARETLRFDVSVDGLAAAQAHVDRLLPGEDLMMQPYAESVETEGELSAIFVDGDFTHGVRKVPVKGDYRVQDDFGAHDEPYDFTPSELQAARDVIEMAPKPSEPLLYARVDWLRDDEGQLCLNELEIVEPSLFFRHGPHAAGALIAALLRRLQVPA